MKLTLWGKLRACWHVIRGRPLAFGLRLKGTGIEADHHAWAIDCEVVLEKPSVGISAGGHSFISHCTVSGVSQYGFQGK